MKLFIYLLALVATATSETPNFSPTRLTVKMFQEVVKANPGENVVLSAISVLSPLTQLSLAAVGESLNEILQSLQLPTEVPRLLELLYDGDQSSLLIVLPNQLEGINDLVEKLKNPVLLSIAVKNMKYEEVIVEIPKFKIETTTDLREVLQKMNIEKIFNPNEARLDNMLKEISNIFIGSAIQKAYVDVDEEGTEAAAFTYIYGEPGSSLMGSPKKSFKADHPFYFELVINNITTFNGVFHN